MDKEVWKSIPNKWRGLIEKGCYESNAAIVHSIRYMLAREWTVRVQMYTPFFVDWLANNSFLRGNSNHFPPKKGACDLTLLLGDFCGVARPRLCYESFIGPNYKKRRPGKSLRFPPGL